jgi:cell division transport system permease protein
MKRLQFILREAQRALVRSGLAGWLAILSLTTVAAFLSAAWGAHQALEATRQGLLAQFELEAFVRPGREAQLDELAQWIEGREGVLEVREIDKEDAAQRFAERFGGEMFDLLEENPLPVSLIVRYDPTVVSLQWIDLEAEIIADHEDIEEVAYEGELLAQLEALGARVSMSLLLVAAVIAGIALFLTFQSVRVAIRTGIAWAHAVRLVGGTERQVHQPFVTAGLLAGLMGGVFGATVVGFAQWALSQGGVIQPPDLPILGAVIGITTLVSALGASAAIGRHSSTSTSA